METKVYFEQDEDILEICKDNVFKAVFTKDVPASRTALSRLVSALIGRDVAIIDILANEIPINSLYDRQVRFDINCRAENGEFINVEMFYNPDINEPVRLEYHVGKLFTAQDVKGGEKYYSDLLRVYQISILAKKKFFNDGSFYHSFEYYDSENKITLGGKTRIITIELCKMENVINKPIEEMTPKEFWAIFFRYLTDKEKRGIINEIVKREEGIAMASEILLTMTKDFEERILQLSIERAELDAQSRMVRAKREGLAEGREEGKREGKLEIVELLKSGKSPEEIIKQYG